MIKGYQSEILKEYEKIRTLEENELKAKIKEINTICPDIIEIDTEIKKQSIKLPITILKSNGNESVIKDIKDKILDLKAKKCEMLVSLGYPADFLTISYQCPKCQDTGFIGVNKCICYKDKLIRLHYKDSELSEIIKDNNFENFNLNLFSKEVLGNERKSPYQTMTETLDYIQNNYLQNFENSDTNLLFFGSAGTGKTFLSYCIAKELLDAGYLVVYKTADELLRTLRDIRFNNNYYAENLIINCDLLIIDDLGSEQITEFSTTELFNLINKKLLKKKKMIISTNLSSSDIAQLYTERVSSRLLGNFKLHKFSTKDIRINLMRHRLKTER